jgi:hypothetical protein
MENTNSKNSQEPQPQWTKPELTVISINADTLGVNGGSAELGSSS